MDIALLNQIITFQKSELTVDGIGNHINDWSDYYQCHATISNESGSEGNAAATVVDNATISFTVRYCLATATISVLIHRIIFQNEIYNIVGIDHMNFKKKCLKFRCEKARR